ncbi:hypothetical protein DXG01_001613 [Tephrocybe rancida]|nr:hypothetical protein DXG01_001613 [Tephrocybe rancida]
MDEILDSFPELVHYDDAARLLSMICPDSVKNAVENDPDSPESFACLLYRRSTLFDQTKRARTSRNFDGVWETCLRCVRPVIKFPGGAKLVPGLLDRISTNIRDLVNGRIFETPLWTLAQPVPGHGQVLIKQMSLHSLMEQENAPPMLFYDLGSFQKDPILNDRVQKLFCINQNTFFVNASATGKTRLIYEGLFQKWGLYVTAHVDEREAGALGGTIKTIFAGEDNLVQYLPEESVLGYQRIVNGNLEALHRRFSIVLLIHLLVFREFLKTAHAEGVADDEDLRRRWLLAQLWYPCLDKGEDVHQRLLTKLQWEPLAIINEELTKVLDDINLQLPPSIKREGLFVAIDEANAAARQLWQGGTEAHPPIRSIIRTWRDRLAKLDCAVTFIVADTAIDPDAFPSTSSEWASWKWTSDTGSFDDRAAQRDYILPFLPPTYAQSASGKALLQRIWNWCRPRQVVVDWQHHALIVSFRHRLTAVLVTMLLEDKMAHPHGVLGRYIQRLMSYEASDAAVFVAKEGPCKVVPFFNGIGRLINKSSRHSVFFFNHPWPDGDVYSSAGYLAWYLARAFTTGHDISDVFAIRAPSWLEDLSAVAHLVVLQKDKYGTVQEMVVEPSDLLPSSPPLGYLADTTDDVIAWLRQERVGAFCVCPSSCYAELFFVLKLHGKYVWVALRTAGRSKKLDEEDMSSEFDLLTAQNLLSCGDQVDAQDANVHQDDLLDALKSLPSTLAPPGSFPVLRVVASFPIEPPLPHALLETGCPVAVLKIGNFQSVTQDFSPEQLIEGLISSFHNTRSPYEEASFSPIGPVSKLRNKRKDVAAAHRPTENTADKSHVAAPSKDGPVRPVPRHMSPPSSPTLTAGSSSRLARQIVKEGSSKTTSDVPKKGETKRLKKESQSQLQETSSSVVSLRRSPRNHKPKVTTGN